MTHRKYLPTLAELIDRLSIIQLKEVFINEHKTEYAKEIQDILHDIQLVLNEQNDKITADTIRAIVVLSQINLHIWHNESNYRKGIKDGNDLELTHGLNGIRNTAKNKIQEIVGGRKDYKIDSLALNLKIGKLVGINMTYKEALSYQMQLLGQKENSIFIGQQIMFAGNPMSTTLQNVPKEKMVELPVMEESQMGISLGLALTGNTVITFYPRWDFLICATNQLVNHVDKIKLMSKNEWNPHSVIRVGKGSDTPLDPGHQHKGNYLTEFSSLCKNIKFHNLKTVVNIENAYHETSKGGIHVLVEYPELYHI